MKRKVWKQTAALALAAAMMATGCGAKQGSAGNESAGNTTSGQEASKEEGAEGFQTTYGQKTFDNTRLSVMVYDRNSAPDGVTVINNRWTDYINQEMEKVGITVEFVAVPRSGDVEKIQTMMASGTAPDIVMSYNGTMVEDYYNQGGIYDLSPYIDGEDQAVNLKTYIGDRVLETGRNKDGALWGITARRSIAARSNMFIRKDWLDKLNMQVPTTPDELYQVLKAFKVQNPDGRKDVVPFASYDMGGKQDVLAMAFMNKVSDEKEYYSNEVSFVYSDDGFVEYLRFMNKMYNDGLIDPEYYAEGNGGQVCSEQFVNGQLGFYVFNVNGNVDSMRGDLLQNLKANYPDADMVSMPPLKNINDGVTYNDGYAESGAYVFVPKTCKNPDAAVTYLDWLATKEGGFTLFHGFEGEHYIDEAGVPVVKDAAYNATDKDWIRHDLFLIGNQGYYATEDDFIKASAKEIPGYEDYVVENYNNGVAGTVCRDTSYTSPLQAEKASDLSLISDEYNVKCITCAPEEFDQIVEDYRAALKDCGIEDIIKERAEHFDEMSK